MSGKNRKYAISIMSIDRPGIVADISGCIVELKGNILEISETVVVGYFTIIIVAEITGDISTELLAEMLRRTGGPGEYSVMVRDFEPKPTAPELHEKDSSENHYILTTTGKNTIGLIHNITQKLAKHNVNIMDISSYLHDDEVGIFAQLDVPESVNIFQLQDELDETCSGRNASIRLQHIDIFKETNRI